MNRTKTRGNSGSGNSGNRAGILAASSVVLLAGCAAMDPEPRVATARVWKLEDNATSNANSNTTGDTNNSRQASMQPRQVDLRTTLPAEPMSTWPTSPQNQSNTSASTHIVPGTAERVWSPNTARVSFSEEGADFDPCVSRDGSKIVFASTQHRATADLYIKRVNSKTVTQLTSGGSDNVMPDISPDGERIAFTTNRNGSWDIFVMPITGGQAVQITSDATDELHPTWSPDGTQLVFSKLGETSGRWEMWVAQVQNPSSPTFIGYGLFPQWCPVAGTGADGADKILFQLSRERGNRTFGLWTVDFGNGIAGNPTEVCSEPSKAFINPTWSPDGQWICFAEIPSAGSAAANEAQTGKTSSRLPAIASLWMIGADGNGKVNLVGGNGASLMPAWGSDGTIYFVSNRGGAENIWSLSSAGAIKAARGPVANPTQRPVANAKPEAEATEE